MAEMNINLVGIHAEIKEGNITMLSNTSITLDPISKSYSSFAPLKSYELTVVEEDGVTDTVILHNGKNSRVSSSGNGTLTIKLRIIDEKGNSDEDEIIINVE